MTMLMQDRPREAVELVIDWCGFEAVKYACTNWHYSKAVPAGQLVKVGAWENGAFIGCVLFSHGANNHIGMPYGMTQHEAVELTRIAMNTHITPVTQIMAKAIRMLKQQCPGLKLIVSYADTDQNHLGAIYQAGNWIYTGVSTKNDLGAFIVHGKKMHPKTVHSKGWKQTIKWLREHVDPNAEVFISSGKHKYLYPLDKKTRASVLALSKPYPKRDESCP